MGWHLVRAVAWLAVAFVQGAVSKDDDAQEAVVSEAGDDAGGADFRGAFGPHGWPAWLVIMVVSFWALAVVVEDFFVPALNVLCVELNVPDDVAGATFMAAGASSPEMFCALISLFVTRSALGIGTIIGSEVFNHLCICAGSVLYSRSGVLELDPRIVGREVAWYTISLLGLLYCLRDTRACDHYPQGCSQAWDDRVEGDERIYIHWHQPLLLMLLYVAYVFTCANYAAIVEAVCPRGRDPSSRPRQKPFRGPLGKRPDTFELTARGRGAAVDGTVGGDGDAVPSGRDERGARDSLHLEPAANFASPAPSVWSVPWDSLAEGRASEARAFDASLLSAGRVAAQPTVMAAVVVPASDPRGGGTTLSPLHAAASAGSAARHADEDDEDGYGGYDGRATDGGRASGASTPRFPVPVARPGGGESSGGGVAGDDALGRWGRGAAAVAVRQTIDLGREAPAESLFSAVSRQRDGGGEGGAGLFTGILVAPGHVSPGGGVGKHAAAPPLLPPAPMAEGGGHSQARLARSRSFDGPSAPGHGPDEGAPHRSHHDRGEAGRQARLGRSREAELRRAQDAGGEGALHAIRAALAGLREEGLGLLLSPLASPAAFGHAALAADLHAVEAGPGPGAFSCYLWTKSRFYSKARVSSRAWQLRWVTVDRHGFRSRKDRHDDPAAAASSAGTSGPGRSSWGGGGSGSGSSRPFNVYQATAVVVTDAKRSTFELRCPTGDVVFQAPSRLIMDRMVRALRLYVDAYATLPAGDRARLLHRALALTSGERASIAAFDLRASLLAQHGGSSEGGGGGGGGCDSGFGASESGPTGGIDAALLLRSNRLDGASDADAADGDAARYASVAAILGDVLGDGQPRSKALPRGSFTSAVAVPRGGQRLAAPPPIGPGSPSGSPRSSAGSLAGSARRLRDFELADDLDAEGGLEPLVAWPSRGRHARRDCSDQGKGSSSRAGSELAWWLAVAVHVVLLPAKASLYYTVPDVRLPRSRGRYLAAVGACFFWLAAWSFAMAVSVEALAAAVGVSDAVAGLTVSAAGTSFPNLVASMVVARQGLGNMAVSNGFGSNVFNVFVGLGLPWFLYCFFAPDGYEVNGQTHTYHGLSAKGVVFPTLTLLAAVVLFVVLLWASDMKLHRGHAYLFIALYVCFVAWAVGWECASPFQGK